MIRAMSKYFGSIAPVFIDGLLYVLIALFGAMMATFTSDDVANFISPAIIFYSKTLSTWGLAVSTAIKLFRSTSYASHVDAKAEANKPLQPDSESLILPS